MLESGLGQNKGKTIILPEIFDLDVSDKLKDDLLEHFEEGDVKIDASSVQRVATNSLLMLISAAKTAQKINVGFTILNPSEPMRGAINRLGLVENFASFTKE